MKRNFPFFLVLLYFMMSRTMEGACQVQIQRLRPVLFNSISFFDRNAYDSVTGAYFSEIDNNGQRLSNRIHTVALSRLIYGLAFSSTFYPENLPKAKRAAEFLLTNLVAEDDHGPYFIATIENGVRDNPDVLDIWQQVNGLNGLTELYRISRDQNLLQRIHELHDAFILRFNDEKFPGLFDTYSRKNGQITDSKSLQSTMYPVMAYLANLREADVTNRWKYEPILTRHLDLAAKKIWNPTTGWVNVKFNRQMEVCPMVDHNYCFTVLPGHAFQLAWFLLRSRDWTFLDKTTREKYNALGIEILRGMLARKEIWDGNVSSGFFSEVNPVSNEIISDRKTWWQTCEAIIAFSMEKQFTKERDHLLTFFIKTFVDFDKGNEFFYVNRDNSPVTSEPKGSKGKSGYHVAELMRFITR